MSSLPIRKVYSDEFIKEVNSIPFYENNNIKQATNKFLLTASHIFCPVEHANIIRALLDPLQ